MTTPGYSLDPISELKRLAPILENDCGLRVALVSNEIVVDPATHVGAVVEAIKLRDDGLVDIVLQKPA